MLENEHENEISKSVTNKVVTACTVWEGSSSHRFQNWKMSATHNFHT